MPTTVSPRFHSAWQSWPPMKPAAPLTSTFMGIPPSRWMKTERLLVRGHHLVAVVFHRLCAHLPPDKLFGAGGILAAHAQQAQGKAGQFGVGDLVFLPPADGEKADLLPVMALGQD